MLRKLLLAVGLALALTAPAVAAEPQILKTEGSATAFCKAENVVWFNPASKIYFPPGSQFYGKTKGGGFYLQDARGKSRLPTTKGELNRPSMSPELSNAERAALVALLKATIDGDRFPPSPRVRELKRVSRQAGTTAATARRPRLMGWTEGEGGTSQHPLDSDCQRRGSDQNGL